MSHFDIARWADHVRGLTNEKVAAKMGLHLESCSRCNQLVTALERVREDAAAERRHPVPAYAARSAKSIFGLQRPERENALTRLNLKLTFDSALAPAAVGARSLHDATRQLLFESEDFALDVRVDYPSGTGNAIVVGQLLGSEGEPVEHARAYLLADGEIGSAGFTSEFGGFYMEGDRKIPLELWLDLDDDRRISVNLDLGGEAQHSDN